MEQKENYQESENRDEVSDSEKIDNRESVIREQLKRVLEKGDTDNKKAPIIVQSLNYIVHNDGIVTGDHASLKDVDIHAEDHADVKSTQMQSDNTKCFIENQNELMSWLTGHYETYEMAFVISMAVFEKMPCLWVYSMAEELFVLWGKTDEKLVEEKIKTANSNRIHDVGGRTYPDVVYNHTGKTENLFICFQKAEYSKILLENVWMEYIFLRESLIKWLAGYISDQNYSKAIRAIKALALFAQLDFDYFSKEVIEKLFFKKSILSDYAMAQIILQVYQNEKYQRNIENIYMHWAKLDNIHYLFTALMIGIANKWGQSRIEIAVERYIDRLIRGISNNTMEEYITELTSFFAIGQRKAVYFKAVAKVLNDKLKMYQGRRYLLQRISTGMAFLLLLFEDDNQSNININNPEKHKDMIFVKMCLIENDTAVKVRELWKMIWTSRELHGVTKKFLERYIYQYGGCDQKQLDYLRDFLYSFQDTESDRRNMDYFLKKIAMRKKQPVKVAERINR